MAKNKLAKFADMDALSNVFQPKHEEVFESEYKLKGKWGKEVFKNDNPIVLEIGCGKGEYAVGLARKFPNKNFIGMDIKGSRMWTGATQSESEGLTNVIFIRSYAEFLESVFADDELSEIWVTFADPQMKKARKRLTGTRFLRHYKKVLKEDGIIHLKTDSNFLYTYTSIMAKENKLEVSVDTNNLYESGTADEILSIRTYYEQQWLDRGKTIKYIRFSLKGKIEFIEPEVEIEEDDYRSYSRSKKQNGE
ncbi:MAG: tRNA (guanosine(46)-N7)-methyltransferase TrmB [Marinifilaceae bacterium]